MTLVSHRPTSVEIPPFDTPILDRVPPANRSRDEILERVTQIKAELRRRLWNRDPNLWASERLGDKLWSGQRKINDSVAKYRRTAVMTCHEIGKSFNASILAGWWLDTHKPGEAFVVTTAPTGPQVAVILWKEIGRVHMRGNLTGRLNQVEWLMVVKDPKTGAEREEVVAMGRKPSDYSPTAFQGIHAPYVLVIVDEANGVRGNLWEAMDSLIANDNSKLICIGNPDDPSGEFFENCKPGSGYNVISIGAFDSPNFTGEEMPKFVLQQLIGKTYVEEKRRKWAPHWYWVNKDGKRCESGEGVKVVCPPDRKPSDTNPFWQSKVLGLFPEVTTSMGLFPMPWITAAQQRELEPGPLTELGADVGGGGDANAHCLRRGSVYRIINEDHEPDTMKTTGNLIAEAKEHGAQVVKVDKIGIGWGVVNRGEELYKEKPYAYPRFVGINVGEAPDEDAQASDDRFANLKAQLYWNLRDLFERGDIDIDAEDQDLAAELAGITWERTSNGKIKIGDKRKGPDGKPLPSPNRAEALMLAAAPTPPENPDWVTW